MYCNVVSQPSPVNYLEIWFTFVASISGIRLQTLLPYSVLITSGQKRCCYKNYVIMFVVMLGNVTTKCVVFCHYYSGRCTVALGIISLLVTVIGSRNFEFVYYCTQLLNSLKSAIQTEFPYHTLCSASQSVLVHEAQKATELTEEGVPVHSKSNIKLRRRSVKFRSCPALLLGLASATH
jgi:hypothetical protein